MGESVLHRHLVRDRVPILHSVCIQRYGIDTYTERLSGLPFVHKHNPQRTLGGRTALNHTCCFQLYQLLLNPLTLLRRQRRDLGSQLHLFPQADVEGVVRHFPDI